jgi:hypothetical protein
MTKKIILRFCLLVRITRSFVARDPDRCDPKEKACRSLHSLSGFDFIKALKAGAFNAFIKSKPGTFVPGFFFCRGGRIRRGLINTKLHPAKKSQNNVSG